jgi:hypothetical protein
MVMPGSVLEGHTSIAHSFGFADAGDVFLFTIPFRTYWVNCAC